MPPRSIASSPNISVSDKDSLLGSNGKVASSTEILSSPTQSGKMSVIQRARALDQRAAAGQQAMTSPRPSPPPLSPFSKNVALGTRFAIPQLASQRSSGTSKDDLKSSEDTKNGLIDKASEEMNGDNVMMAPTASEEVLEETEIQEDDAEYLEGTLDQVEEPLTEGGSPREEDHDETPRQSTSYSESPNRISRQDSSRQANYSLKPMTYSPDLGSNIKRSESTAPPRLPMLFFEGQGQAKVEVQQSFDRPAQLRSPSLRNEPSRRKVATGAYGASDSPESKLGLDTFNTSETGHDIDASNQSFLWHSPHESADETDDEEIIRMRITQNPLSSPEKPSTLTSATALGFGGPSDWEHFYGGDYETTDLIDDTDLYLSKGNRGEQNTENSEQKIADEEAIAYCDPSIEENLHLTDQQTSIEPKISSLPTIEESQESEELSIITQHVNYDLGLDDFSRSPPPITPAGPHRPATALLSKPSSEKYDDMNDSALSLSSTKSNELTKPSTLLETVPQDSDDGDVVQKPLKRQSLTDESALQADDDETHDVVPSSNGQPSRTPPPTEIQMPGRDILSQNELVSGPSSPPADDPNASEITISMVLPPDFDPVSPIAQNTHPPLKVADSRKSVFPQGEEQPNPYAGLNPMAKASLNRFIRMLREEEKTEADHDKYYVFVNFARREMKLRATLYDMDEEPETSLPPSARASAMSLSKRNGRSPSTAGRRSSTNSPRAMSVMDPTIGRLQSILASSVSSRNELSSLETKSQEVLVEQLKIPGKTVQGNGSTIEHKSINDTPTTTIVKEDGRELTVSKRMSIETLNKSIELVAPRTSMISAALPITASQRSFEDTPNESPLPGAQILEHSLSMKSNEGRPYDGDKASNRQSIYRPFSGMLRSSSSHRRKSGESVVTVRSVEKPVERKDDDIKLLSVATDKPPPAFKGKSADNLVEAQAIRQSNILQPLLAIIPQDNILHEEHRQLASLRSNMDEIKDDFSFIHKTVVDWNEGAKIKREQYEHERRQRESDNEHRVDELFNDNEIGYGDISHLEDEFKTAESARKAEEEREEVESFVSSVFDVVWARINYELDQLTPLYEQATKLVADASAGRQMFDDTDERVPIAPIMEILLMLYQKLMVRHQKAFEAVLERDRRLKKTEVSPWFGFGAFDKVKRIEKRFEDAEKKAVLEFCRQRDDRANQLMDVLDPHTLRGVGANQDYMESIMQAVRRIAVHLITKRGWGEDSQLQTSINEVVKAKMVTVALSRSSEQIVRTFHVADMLLNAADYEVSVANAKLSSAEATAFRRLRDAKTKEDTKLANDLEHRLGLIRSDTSRTQEEMSKLLTLLGSNTPELNFDITKERDKRMVTALTEARNKLERPPPLPEK